MKSSKGKQEEIRKPSSKINEIEEIGKEIEKHNRMGKTRDPFRKIRATKGTFHEKMDTIKDRNSIDLQKQKILLRGGNNTQKSYTK